MSDEQDKPVEEQPEAESQVPRCGERLAEARRERQISVLEVAKELHLDEPKVRALERNDFEVLGAPVFAKGHLRKYAQLVGVDADDVFADYYQMTRQETIPPVIVGRRRIRQELSPGPWIAVIIVIIVAAASYWWFAVFADQAAPPATTPEETPVEQNRRLPPSQRRSLLPANPSRKPLLPCR
jgi:cytoskeletal protein RodZ